MKKLIAVLLCLLVLSGCAKGTKTNEIKPQPHSSGGDAVKSQAVYSGEPSLSVTQTVAYLFPELTGNELYCACEIKNDSNCPCIISSLTYYVNTGEKTVSVNSSQPASDFCVILPGETCYNTAWTGIQPSEDMTVSVSSVDITAQKSELIPIRITAENLFTVRNYPSFITLSGDMESEENAQLNLIYAGFYDENDTLLGVWCFTEPTELVKGKPVHFTSHLINLPIENLETDAKTVRVSGFGYNSN